MTRWMACVACALCLAVAGPARAQRSLRGGQPSPAQRLYLEGKQAAAAREYSSAVTLFQKALDRATHTATRANILNDLGEAYYELEQFEEARDAFEAALNIRPNFTRARANLDIVHWALPDGDDAPRERLSPKATFAGQVVGSYMTGAVIGGWFVFFGRLMGYKDTDGQLALLSAGMVFGSTLRVSEVAKEWSYGHGAQRNAVAGAFVAPLAGVFAAMLAGGADDGGSRVRGARIGAYFSPLLASAGYTL
ncbi:tetratricopeptide repeat protein, partial [Candidatus Poribacteria bacterium]|nr:tetratricopeptide repeat protein [Candidatus Poribacteria bacterium]